MKRKIAGLGLIAALLLAIFLMLLFGTNIDYPPLPTSAVMPRLTSTSPVRASPMIVTGIPITPGTWDLDNGLPVTDVPTKTATIQTKEP